MKKIKQEIIHLVAKSKHMLMYMFYLFLTHILLFKIYDLIKKKIYKNFKLWKLVIPFFLLKQLYA